MISIPISIAIVASGIIVAKAINVTMDRYIKHNSFAGNVIKKVENIPLKPTVKKKDEKVKQQW
ncbi:MAG: hypothetical protein HOD11_08045 [Candidatus Marinimicrobia bacterium]|nr:hypothetical protein [Candidatus Neomarinimicrobiota bacterium]